MDFETMGIGASSGFISAVLTLLGWNRRLNQQELRLAELEREKIGEKMCDQKHKEVSQIQADIKEIKEMVNRLLFNQLNGGRKP